MIPEPGLPSRLSPGQVERTRRILPTAAEADYITTLFQAGRSITDVQRATNSAFDLRTLGELKAMAGRGSL